MQKLLSFYLRLFALSLVATASSIYSIISSLVLNILTSLIYLAQGLGIEPNTRSFGDSIATLEHGPA